MKISSPERKKRVKQKIHKTMQRTLLYVQCVRKEIMNYLYILLTNQTERLSPLYIIYPEYNERHLLLCGTNSIENSKITVNENRPCEIS